MVILMAVGFTLIGLLGIVMVATTRHLVAHPEEPVHGHGAGSWSDGLAAARPGSPVPDTPASLLSQPATTRARGASVPLDDMPAAVVAEAASRLRRRHRTD